MAARGGGDATFEQQRAVLIDQIAQKMEQIISNVNLLNRNLEGIVAVGKEFDSVSTLWRSFHDVLSREPRNEDTGEGQSEGEEIDPQ